MTRYREPESGVVHAARKRWYYHMLDRSSVLLACMDGAYYRYNRGMARIGNDVTLTCLECITEESDNGGKQT